MPFVPTLTEPFRTQLVAAASARAADPTTTTAFVDFVRREYHATQDFERTADVAAIWAAFTHVRPARSVPSVATASAA
ncbi:MULTISPECIES: hypothetical protein [unclassified Curtobacterium]|uniref:hypothetical protein n=1 Tax=unclassified Curtobacterium TaxID=257496 RepID=UPI000DA89F23|nr:MULTISPECIES: hypothetical protein [unclassified Curtobacterium]PZE23061.1 hypothetical protein DEI86_15655 [Curtobacterium sp. MCBD17_028]PZE71525.1 hypothetical protein DEI82_15625 [Curtobacterium sp. MCBD17_019]PZF56212.1 hypothetical protein DEI92_15080 [Curtobacterium sp. MCBD17_034]PZF57077.1 hypothetical protein DEI81_15600 [Curtobacterium sp. MCBD17_013]PZM32882.1 hypothetical protein DEI90_15670 [Curtobacterium sp. MCBD17_031]